MEPGEVNACCMKNCSREGCMICLPIASSNISTNLIFCLIHFYGSKFALKENENYVTVSDRDQYNIQLRTSTRIIDKMKEEILRQFEK